ncbi:MAG: WD40 repeat domain-containing protein [Anaerolineae bacterium]
MAQFIVLSVLLFWAAFLPPTYPNPQALQQVALADSDTPRDVLWSPDGKTLAAVTSLEVVLYDADQLDAAETQRIPHLIDETVSFEADGRLRIGNALWNIQQGTSEAIPEKNPPQRSPSGQFEVSSTDDGQQTVVEISDTQTKSVTELMTGSSGKLGQVVFSPDEQFIVLQLGSVPDVAHGFESAQLWDVGSGTMVATLRQSAKYMELIAFHPNGRFIVTISSSDPDAAFLHSIRVWNGQIGDLLFANDEMVYPSVVFSPDGRLMAYPVTEGLMLWRDHLIGTLSLLIPEGDYEVYAGLNMPLFSPDGKFLFASYGTQIYVWDNASAQQLGKPKIVLDNTDYVVNYFLSEQGTQLIVQTDNANVRIWDLTKQNPEMTQILYDVTQGQPSPDSKYVWGYSPYPSNDRLLFDTTSGEILQKLPTATQLDPNWKYAAYWADGALKVVDLTSNVTYDLKPLIGGS